MIVDNGLGLFMEGCEVVLVVGCRFDECGDGYGFGLLIMCEFVEFYGGDLMFEIMDVGGLVVILILFCVIV